MICVCITKLLNAIPFTSAHQGKTDHIVEEFRKYLVKKPFYIFKNEKIPEQIFNLTGCPGGSGHLFCIRIKPLTGHRTLSSKAFPGTDGVHAAYVHKHSQVSRKFLLIVWHLVPINMPQFGRCAKGSDR